VPFTKTEPQPDGSLIVEGYAMTEQLGRSGEVIDYEGAKEAFEGWPGNIREQHDPNLAVGRELSVDFEDDGRRIFVRGRVSSGAPNTVKKVLDGTLTGYSVGGKAATRGGRSAARVDDALVAKYGIPETMKGDTISVLKQWRMVELSLVDSPDVPNTTITVAKSDGEKVTMTKDLDSKATVTKQDEAPTATPAAEPPPAEPANPAADELGIVAHLDAAKMHLAEAAKMAVDEVSEHGAYCVRVLAEVLGSIEEIRQSKLYSAAMEAASATVTASDGAARSLDVIKGAVSYKLDKKEKKAMGEMATQLRAYAEAVEKFANDFGEAEEEKKNEAAEAEGAEEKKPNAEEAPKDKGEELDTKKKIDAGGGEVAEQNEAKPAVDGKIEKAAKGGDVAAVDRSSDVLKAVEGLGASLRVELADLAKRIGVVERQPAISDRTPVTGRSVEKSINLGGATEGPGDVDVIVDSAFRNLRSQGIEVTEQSIRNQLALSLYKSGAAR
jgi:hypothetical protein